jgi:hypothetical protein
MKNIHLVPTYKPSRLVLETKNNNLFITTTYFKNDLMKHQNIYITNNSEIKEGVDQWYLDKFLNKPMNSGGAQYEEKQNVIILTTDQDLIKDGVQAIDDEFIEWFVKNPSCEEVEIDKGYRGIDLFNYKIIIPKEEPNPFELPKALPDDVFYQSLEEPKQDTVGKVFFESADKVITVKRQEKKPHSFCETPEEKCTMNYCDENGCQNRVRHLVEQKQHLIDLMRLDEEQQTFIKPNNVDGQWLSPVPTERAWQEEKLVEIFEHYPTASPRWQYMNGLIQNSLDAKQMYSEEDILDAWELGAKEGLPLTREKKEKLFKQFKKK